MGKGSLGGVRAGKWTKDCGLEPAEDTGGSAAHGSQGNGGPGTVAEGVGVRNSPVSQWRRGSQQVAVSQPDSQRPRRINRWRQSPTSRLRFKLLSWDRGPEGPRGLDTSDSRRATRHLRPRKPTGTSVQEWGGGQGLGKNVTRRRGGEQDQTCHRNDGLSSQGPQERVPVAGLAVSWVSCEGGAQSLGGRKPGSLFATHTSLTVRIPADSPV